MTKTIETRKKIFSIDLEVDGLYGTGFAVAAIVADAQTGEVLSSFEGRIADEHVQDGWVKDNVLPVLGNMPVTHETVEDLEEALWGFYAEYCLVEGQWGLSANPDVAVIAHCGSPVESGFFRRCIERDESRSFQAPLPLHEVGTLLLAVGENPSSVDSYIKKFELEVGFDGLTHHPMYDCYAALAVWQHIMARLAS